MFVQVGMKGVGMKEEEEVTIEENENKHTHNQTISILGTNEKNIPFLVPSLTNIALKIILEPLIM